MIPDVRQRTNYDCGPAVVKSVLGHFNVRRSLDYLTGRLLTSAIDGTDPRSIESYLRSEGFRVLAGEMTLDDLSHFTRAGRLVVCLLSGHYVVVTRTARGRVHVHDPIEGPDSYTSTDFLSHWTDCDRWGVTYTQFGICVSRD